MSVGRRAHDARPRPAAGARRERRVRPQSAARASRQPGGRAVDRRRRFRAEPAARHRRQPWAGAGSNQGSAQRQAVKNPGRESAGEDDRWSALETHRPDRRHHHGDRGRDWLYSELPSIRSYLDEPKSLAELQQHAGQSRPGYDNHHVVEQGAGSREGFPRSAVDGMDNVISIPRYKHHEITGWFNRRNPDFGMLTPRDYLRGRDWAEHVRVGHRALRQFKVLK